MKPRLRLADRRTPGAAVGAAVLAVICTFALTACGTSTKSAAPKTTATTSVSPGGTAPVDTTFTGKGSAQYCQLAKTYAQATAKIGPGATADLRQLFDSAATDIKAAVAVAPAEIKPDVQTVAAGFSDLVTALDNANYNFTALPSTLIARYMAADFVAASTRVAAYARQVCGITG